MSARITIHDIARCVGVHYSTVSLALRDSPRIARETRVKVQEIASALGYRPDAMVAALAAYRGLKRAAPPGGVIAWLHNHVEREGWRQSACTLDYFAGASARAEERGYRVETFWLAEPGMTGRRMSQILRTRGIRGIFLSPQERIGSIDLDWEDFSAVAFGYTLAAPRLHLVSNHEYRTMGTLFAELARRGYRQVGLVDLQEHDERVDHNWLAAYLIEQYRLAPDRQLPPLILEAWDDGRFLDWFWRHRPEAIVTKLPCVLACLARAGCRVPADVGVAFHSLDEGAKGVAGMRKNARQLGVMAFDHVADMINRHERGVPAHPRLYLLEGTWTEGATLRPFDAALQSPSVLKRIAPAMPPTSGATTGTHA